MLKNLLTTYDFKSAERLAGLSAWRGGVSSGVELFAESVLWYLLIMILSQQSLLSNLSLQHNLSQNYKGNPEDISQIQP